MKKWEELSLVLDNTSSERGQGDYKDKTQKLFKTREFKISNKNFHRFCSEGTNELVRVMECLNKS